MNYHWNHHLTIIVNIAKGREFHFTMEVYRNTFASPVFHLFFHLKLHPIIIRSSVESMIFSTVSSIIINIAKRRDIDTTVEVYYTALSSPVFHL